MKRVASPGSMHEKKKKKERNNVAIYILVKPPHTKNQVSLVYTNAYLL